MQNIPKWSFLVGEPMVVGYQHFRKPPYQSHLAWTAFCNRCLVAPCSLWWQADSKELLESVEPLEKLGVNGPSVLHYGFRQSPIWAWFTTIYIYIYPLYIFVLLCISLYQARSMYDCMLLWEDVFFLSAAATFQVANVLRKKGWLVSLWKDFRWLRRLPQYKMSKQIQRYPWAFTDSCLLID